LNYLLLKIFIYIGNSKELTYTPIVKEILDKTQNVSTINSFKFLLNLILIIKKIYIYIYIYKYIWILFLKIIL